ncbi:(2Fe-2S)-binding protein [Paracoccus seriniphilus]|uniref:Aerobic-type carbon monoxide dehydrogenase, small subunit, CoxS/CutS family n=1 Tax=Paracoccus seriniphilus TaxID=184748 RepID=A0A239PZW9_9RHOB|nr:2Fe-2S iron-sulfur cluster-binding protein [Paracoccus seriniphilus]WCR16329.1 2Fe-2S iron-sulfur cluster binding domain-containing protein [Paracoccus seriniphilus]SNT75795.1 Aerobic-type carbon monoxide dehydrogenase, small subunit, CoxS/CutS family [Paracoccus seriniphilus]
MAERISFSATINGQKIGPMDLPQDLMMVELLQEYLNLTGTRLSCGQGVCSACTIIIDDPDKGSYTVPACVTGVTWVNGRTVRTIEGIAGRDDQGNPVPSPIQMAFLEHFAFQCSYCTPGFVNGATALIERLQRQPIPSDQVEAAVLEALDRHICRCTGYVRYYEAVRDVILSTPGLTTDGPGTDVTAMQEAGQ